MQLPELWVPRDIMSPVSFLSLDTGRWICAINSLLSKILRSSKGWATQVSRKTSVTWNITESKEQRCHRGSAEGECGPGNISSLFLLFPLSPALPSSLLAQTCPSATTQHCSQGMRHCGTEIHGSLWSSRSAIKPDAFGVHLALHRELFDKASLCRSCAELTGPMV